MTQPTCNQCGETVDMTFHGACINCAGLDDNPDDGPELEDMFDCGMMPDGTCLLAGTEDCDWECPYR